ncbi:PTPA-domain-containing protein [Choiromyces venosus 120613-1]|uniref:Serine/threonine-protein phosphatase 2A activator n=1 Tax=Choiromyces venosus 120613-1 TaxID=1336337 RepID=A0A3N4JS93_9PEZI|nr:PTPA-domain-containing protein [Choiromyces venosus 120613-1]
MASNSVLQPIDPAKHTFAIPTKRIHVQEDVPHFLTSPAYKLITSFILHLNASASPLNPVTGELSNPQNYMLTSPTINVSPEVDGVIQLIHKLEALMTQAPPDPGPRRFGNTAYRHWYVLVEAALSGPNSLLDQHLPASVLSPKGEGEVSAKQELLPYLFGSFGSSQRLDYGTGHELSFLAFLCGIWVLGGFQAGRDELGLALKCLDAYLHLVRRLVTTYTLEPAGSHGVWGLDDHSFLPYIFGSAELTTHPPTDSSSSSTVPVNVEGLEDVPKPGDVVKSLVVERERLRNLYFGAIGFIYDVKKGPFWEHSPILYDISGVQGGWGKINKGMIKMFNAEVLGKFPVVQHFRFGSIFSWGGSTDSADTATITHRTQAPHAGGLGTGTGSGAGAGSSASSGPGTRALENLMTSTAAPWTRNPAQSPTIGSNTDFTTRAAWGIPASTVNQTGSTAGRFPVESSTSRTAPRPLPGREPSVEDARAPWATGEADKHPPSPDIKQATEANLGPKRTSSPDSKLATMEGEEGRLRRGSVGTGGVRVAETGDLKKKSPPPTKADDMIQQ